ncbi:reverse transcriptase domain-containing protein, partial [Empedobacter sp. 189-2]|uniref:reverse transcriptase domain-containing protein n=1 Tax=Empedobacter sp. 189-2 TaxID=2746724 RepID=UPI0025762CAE
IMETGVMPDSISEGMIHLIPKEGGDRLEIRQWRPITLLGTAYKVLAKAISRRLQPHLPDIIHTTQTGFIQDRSILDNIFSFWEATALARFR